MSCALRSISLPTEPSFASYSAPIVLPCARIALLVVSARSDFKPPAMPALALPCAGSYCASADCCVVASTACFFALSMNGLIVPANFSTM